MRLPVKQPTRLPTKLHPLWGELIKRRYFRTNSGTTDYVQLATPVELQGDFEIEFVIYVSSEATRIMGTHTPFDSRFFARISDGSKTQLSIGIVSDSVNSNITTGASFLSENKLNRILFSRTGSEGRIDNLDTGAVATGAITTDTAVLSCLCRHLLNYFSGGLSEVKVKSSGNLIHHWPMNEKSGDTHYDVVGGNHGTIINGTAGDFELFERLQGGDEWVGRDIATTENTELLGDDSDPEFVTVAAVKSGCEYRIFAEFKAAQGSFDAGFAIETGVPQAPPFRKVAPSPGDSVGGSYLATASWDLRLFGRNGCRVSYEKISVRRILEIA